MGMIIADCLKVACMNICDRDTSFVARLFSGMYVMSRKLLFGL